MRGWVMWLVPVLLAAATAGDGSAAHAQQARQGWLIVARSEVVSATASNPTPIRTSLFPDGSAEVEYVTDGRSFRGVTRGRFGEVPDGTVTLRIRTERDQYIINPAERTYRRSATAEPIGQRRGDATIEARGAPEPIAGYPTEKVVMNYVETVPAAGGAPAREQRAEVQAWCSKNLRWPSRMFVSVARGFVDGPAWQRFEQACPVPLKSSVVVSLMPQYLVVTGVVSVRRAPLDAAAFRLPSGFREVQR